jgi:hypothetical protein
MQEETRDLIIGWNAMCKACFAEFMCVVAMRTEFVPAWEASNH